MGNRFPRDCMVNPRPTTDCGICRGHDACLQICSETISKCVHKECLSEMLEPNSDVPTCPFCSKLCALFVKTLLDLDSPFVVVLRARIERRRLIDSLQPNQKLA